MFKLIICQTKHIILNKRHSKLTKKNDHTIFILVSDDAETLFNLVKLYSCDNKSMKLWYVDEKSGNQIKLLFN